MPSCWPVWIAEYICATLSSRIRLRMAGVPTMISQAAVRPPPTFFSSACEITARRDSDSIDRIIDVFPAGEKPMVRSMLSESLRAVISQALLKKVGGGRTAAWEIMVGIPAIRNLIREDKVAQMYSAIQTGQNAGMMTLDQHLQDLVKRGMVSRQQAREYAKDKRLFE